VVGSVIGAGTAAMVAAAHDRLPLTRRVEHLPRGRQLGR
jgi:hypothetical protein